jgi:hypothetical protein
MIVLYCNLSDLEQSINIVESPRLKKIFLLLRKELMESDIPGQTTIQTHIMNMFSEHLKMLEEDMKVSLAILPYYFDKQSARDQWGRSHSLLMYGQIPTSLLSWQLQPTGLRGLR